MDHHFYPFFSTFQLKKILKTIYYMCRWKLSSRAVCLWIIAAVSVTVTLLLRSYRRKRVLGALRRQSSGLRVFCSVIRCSHSSSIVGTQLRFITLPRLTGIPPPLQRQLLQLQQKFKSIRIQSIARHQVKRKRNRSVYKLFLCAFSLPEFKGFINIFLLSL